MQGIKNRRAEKGGKMSKDLSIVIPIYNEAGCLETNVAVLAAYLEAQPVSWELLLVNDGSTDDSAAICRKIADRHRAIYWGGYATNRGGACC